MNEKTALKKRARLGILVPKHLHEMPIAWREDFGFHPVCSTVHRSSPASPTACSMGQAGRERELQPHTSPRCPACSERRTGTAEGDSGLYKALRLKKYILKLL